MRILAVVGLAVIAAGAGVSRQTAPPQQPSQQPSFRVSTDVVAVDVTVIGRDGAPVKGLQAEDFTVRVDGQSRRIVSMQFIDQSTDARPVTAGEATPTSATFLRVSSNQTGGTGRLILLLVDQNSIPFGQLRVAADSVGQLLAAFGPADRIALATLPGPRVVLNFGADRQRIVDAIKGIPGNAARRDADAYEMGYVEAFGIDGGNRAMLDRLVDRECTGARFERDGAGKQAALESCIRRLQAQASQMAAEARRESTHFAGALRALLSTMASIDAPKLIILFSTGFVAPDAMTDFAFLSGASAAAHTAIYAVRLDRGLFDVTQSRGPASLFEDRDAALGGLDAIVGRARGSVVEVTGSAQPPFARLAREMSAYYLIGIETTSADRDGKTHRIAVVTAKPGLTVRARPEFVFTPAAPPKASANAADDLDTVAKTLASPLPASGLPVRVTIFNMADDDPAKVRVMVVAELDHDQPHGDAAAVGYVVLDAQGKAAAGFTRRLPLEKASSGALAFVSVVSIRPGAYTLKLAGVHGGRAGSVEHRFTAGVTSAGPLQLGDLVVGDPFQAQGKMITPSLEARLRGDRIWAFVQLGGDAGGRSDARLALDILKHEDGAALLSAPLLVEELGKRLRVAQVNLDGWLLPPGDYIARVTVSASGKPLGAISTAFVFERHRSPSGAQPVTPPGVARFKPQDVLDSAVLGPFLDELGGSASEANRAAIDTAKAGRFYEAVQKLGPARTGDPIGPFIRGLALFSNGQLQPASDAFRQAIGAAPDFLLGAFYIGACYAAGGREQQAISAWQTSLVRLDRYPVVYRVLADALMRAGQAGRAAELLNEAQGRWPDDEALGMRLAQAGVESGRYDQAAPALDRLIARQPDNADLLFLAMQSAFESAIDATGPSLDGLLSALKRYRDLYVAANGPRQALVAEWVSFVESRAK